MTKKIGKFEEADARQQQDGRHGSETGRLAASLADLGRVCSEPKSREGEEVGGLVLLM
jgi:hypothetical protein